MNIPEELYVLFKDNEPYGTHLDLWSAESHRSDCIMWDDPAFVRDRYKIVRFVNAG